MFCPRCGTDAGSNAFCPACGNQLNENAPVAPQTRKVIINRPSAYGGGYVLNILVDDCFVDILKAHQTIKIDVEANQRHTLQIDSNGHGSERFKRKQPFKRRRQNNLQCRILQEAYSVLQRSFQFAS